MPVQLPLKIEFEIAAVIIYLVILYDTYSEKKLPSLANRLFKLLLGVAFSVTLLNLITVFMIAQNKLVPLFLNYVINYIDLLLQSMVAPIAFLYICELTGKIEERKTRYLFLGPLMLIITAFAAAPITGFVFYFDAKRMYHQGPGMIVLYAAAIFYLILSYVNTFKYQNYRKKHQRAAIALFTFSAVGAAILQFFYPKMLLMGFISSVACLILRMNAASGQKGTVHVTEVMDMAKNEKEDANKKKISELEEQKRLLEKISKEAEAARVEAERADHTKSIFLANMSHEIRTPMNAILGMTELVLRDTISEQVRENVENIKSAGKDLVAIINDILDISKIESGKIEIIQEKYHLSSVIHDISNMISTRLVEKNVELKLDIDNNLPDVLLGDELRLRQIILNLLTNAVKFTMKGYVRLSMHGKIEGDFVDLNIAVEDTGFGIKEEDLEHLFESFARFDGIKTRLIEGTGLGLAICKQLLTLMGGEVRVESEYGKGSTFYLDLRQQISDKQPIMEVVNKKLIKILVIFEDEKDTSLLNTLKNMEITATYETASASVWILLNEVKFSHIFMPYRVYKSQKNLVDELAENTKVIIISEFGRYLDPVKNLSVIQKPIYCLNVGEVLNENSHLKEKNQNYETFIAPEARVLIVDDNAVNLKVAEGLLNPYKMQITKALSGRECLELLKSRQYDLIFLDHMMPEMDGMETLREIRANEEEYFKKLKVVALTANAVRGIREMFIANGFDDYISKPIDTNQLDEVLKKNLPPEFIKQETGKNIRVKEKFPYIINGVNTQKGLESCGGSVHLYWDLLRTVLLEGRIKNEQMKEYISTDNIKSYMVEAHALKSVAASVGAMELSALAKKNEEEAKAQNFVFLQSRGRELLDMYGQFLDVIEALLKFHDKEIEQSRKSPITQEQQTARLDKIVQLLLDYEDEEALLEIKELKKFELSDTDLNKVQRAEDAVKILNYSVAVAILKE